MNGSTCEMWLSTTTQPPSAGILLTVDPPVRRGREQRRLDDRHREGPRPPARLLQLPDAPPRRTLSCRRAGYSSDRAQATRSDIRRAARPPERIDGDAHRPVPAAVRRPGPASSPRRSASRASWGSTTRHAATWPPPSPSTPSPPVSPPTGWRAVLVVTDDVALLRGAGRPGLPRDPRRGLRGPQRHPAPGRRRGGPPLARPAPGRSLRRPPRPAPGRPRRGARRGRRARRGVVRRGRGRASGPPLRRARRRSSTRASAPGSARAHRRERRPGGRRRAGHRCAATSTTSTTCARPSRSASVRGRRPSASRCPARPEPPRHERLRRGSWRASTAGGSPRRR